MKFENRREAELNLRSVVATEKQVWDLFLMDPQNIYSFASVTQFVVYTGKGSLLRNCLSGCQATPDIPKDGFILIMKILGKKKEKLLKTDLSTLLSFRALI